ncbi:MAG: LamG domain-containing protein [Candidatus Roizmanbacteria bacterium]|nr:LamG domain-containing protein [Candidatus Roizmanbacteria bacterium]
MVNKADGTNLTNQAYNFIFTLYDAASGGTQLPSGSPWSETQSLTVTDGIFRATLGAVTPIPTTVDFNSDSIYLNISFSGETFTTRIRFTAVPYAFNSEKVNGLTVTATTGTLTIPSATTVTFSGANNLTFTTSNITSATLPAGTITLADTSSNQTFTTKTIGSTGLVFSGAATDITTVSNEDFIVTPQGTGKVGIGGAPTEMLGVVGNATASGNITLGGQLQVGRFGYDPIAFGNGSIAYNTTTNKLRCYQNGAWTDCIGTGVGGGTLQTVYDASSVSEVTLNTTNNGLTILNAAADAITGNLFEVGNNAGSTLFLGVTKTGSSFNANAVTTENALSLSATGLTTGNGLLLTVGNPEANSNSGTFSKGDLINISSANHTYMTLDNKDLTIGGHKTNITISGVTDVFMYDTGGDMDGGKWTDGARAMASTWYNETLDDASADCNIATMDRCDQKAFPNKAIIVSTATNVYIFNALNNSMWMRFDKGPTTTEWMIGPTTNSTVSTVFALNGKLYIGNAGSVGQMFGVNFISDIAKKYNATDDYQGNIKVGSRNSAVTWVSSIGQPLPGTVISDIYGNVINGKVYIAIALEPTNGSANGSASVLNETDQTIVNFGISGSNTASKNIWLTPVGDLYTTIGSAVTNSGSTNYFIKAKHQIQNLFPNSNNNTFSEIYGNVGTSTTQYGVSVVDAAFGSVTFANGPAPVDATFIPQSLFVTAGTSIDNGRSNTIYVGNNDNLMLLQEKQATPIQGNVKYYTKDYISEYMFSDVRGMWPLSGTSPLNDVSVTHVASNNLTNNGTSTFTSGVRGTGATFSGSSQYLSLADNVPMSVTGSVSFGGWFKTNSTSTQQYIVTKNGSYTLEVTAAGKVQAVITGASTGTRISTNSIDTGWHQVIAVYNSAKPSLDLYLDGILTNGTLTGTLPSAISDTAGAFNIGANAGANFFNGSIDEVFVTADAIDASIIKSMYRVGYRALSMHSSDTLQQLVGSSSQVNAAAVDLEGGTIYAGTAGGGVTVIGNDTDSQIKTYTASGPADDTGTTFANSTINSFSIGRGFGVGDITVIGNGAGVWIESADTSIKDFLSQAYNPFGITMDQSILNVDNVLRVTNQLSTRLDNLAAYGSPQIGLIEFFRADANGAAATNYQSMGGALTLQAGKLDPNIKFLDPNGTIKGRLDVSSPYGTGADGPIAVSTTKNLNTDAIANGRTRPDGIAYRVNAPASGAVGVTSFTRYTATDDLSNGIAAGDEVLLINMQGNTADIADVGKYLFLKVGAITPSTITFIGGTGNTTFGGGTPGNQKVFIQRVPNYTSVALSGSGILTATAYSTTAPTAPAGWSTGIVAFRSNSTVTLATGTSINVTGKGYRGGAGGTAGANGGVSGETIDSLSLTVGSGVGQGGNGATAPTAGYGGGRGGDGALTAPGTGATANRGGGGGGGSAGSTGTGRSWRRRWRIIWHSRWWRWWRCNHKCRRRKRWYRECTSRRWWRCRFNHRRRWRYRNTWR